MHVARLEAEQFWRESLIELIIHRVASQVPFCTCNAHLGNVASCPKHNLALGVRVLGSWDGYQMHITRNIATDVEEGWLPDHSNDPLPAHPAWEGVVSVAEVVIVANSPGQKGKGKGRLSTGAQQT